jgi:hypothetical protein
MIGVEQIFTKLWMTQYSEKPVGSQILTCTIFASRPIIFLFDKVVGAN